MSIVFYFSLGAIFGFASCIYLIKVLHDYFSKKETNRANAIYQQINDQIKNKSVKFVNRQGNFIYLTSKMDEYGKVNIVYILNKREVILQKKSDESIIPTLKASKQIVDDLISTIEKTFDKEINDVIVYAGVIVSRIALEKKIKKMIPKSDIEKITDENSKKNDLDTILDKISQFGFDKLTLEEKEFLKSFK